MYVSHFNTNEDREEVLRFVKSNSFGILITSSNGIPHGTHIPLELENDGQGNKVIYGHISKANPQWQHFEKSKEVLVIYNGPHAYVSSSWYNHENVPTWNYIAVHVYGTIQVLEKEELLESLHKLVDKYEAHSEHPVHITELSEKTMKQINGIVGFKINISDIQANYKLSNNRNNEDHKSVVQHLENSHLPLAKEIAGHMKNRRKHD